ncbi:MAG: fibronectin type III domain-containing protein [Marinobacter sp.]|uniref:fibronectin type III domain-containing protein n=1 Tax=Marinobacter sp. TaxID=50741 RepID=UPI00299E9412|nr:fibronectin type III domain-containing protein [Marinobacter sp.]MDX1755126.1 fibronectin type III domain-containing protein [Marinobacter sp.]
MHLPVTARLEVIGSMMAGLLGLLLLSGCQEDTGSSAATSPAAAQVAAQREGKAVNSLKRLFDQPDAPARHTASRGDTKRPLLEWHAPLTRENGTALYISDIQGYRLYYRLRHEQTFQWVEVEGAENTRYPLEEFEAGAYEFAITALDSTGLESQKSAIIEVDLI